MSYHKDFPDYITEVFSKWIQAEVSLLKLIFETSAEPVKLHLEAKFIQELCG